MLICEHYKPSGMKTKLLFLSTLLFSFTISAQLDFAPHMIVNAHPDVDGPYSIVAADIDGDGDMDLVATSTIGNKIVWFENLDGQGNFSQPKVITATMDYPMDIAIADINGNGNLDIIAVSKNDNKIVWFENIDGLGNFGPTQLIASFQNGQTVQAADMDGDGDIDIIVGGEHKIIWLENMDGLGTFGPEIIVSNILSYTESIVVSDIDGDGDMDVVVVDVGREIVSWYENIDGHGTFGPELIIANNAGVYSIITTDIDNDGDLDVVTTLPTDSLVWFENTDGSGNFSTAITIAADPGFIHKLFAADLNSDGDNDILAALYADGEIIWIENDGAGNFGEPQVIYSDVFQAVNVIAADFNGDGKMDVAAGIWGSNQIIWFENKGPLSVEKNKVNLFSLYPNPTSALLNIKSIQPISEINIYNNLGQLLLRAENTNQVDVTSLSQGIYLINIKDENGGSETQKFIRN